ncbi:coiled-coil domain-containing protein 178-like [Gigantopelta aegis]|uniref:coiled-coil domain-containing protein 178-like n=1 Tax=Gigantopelta aegis TaxID=1735272 RepID=UPI001B8893ED|nr:coiled-coil domain-containing protein 178-like [Gigantopelta aegis]XP_041357080.1 coiled-coil domain-containing protein 178-like [Gigantopelta aegis]
MAKVVRVEQVAHPDDGIKSLDKNLGLTGERDVFHDDGDMQAVDIFGGEDESVKQLEGQDTICALPDNWPKIPEIARRRSCELIKSSTPCVKKAVSHLELIQNVIDDSFKKANEGTVSRISNSQESLKSCVVPNKKQLRFAESRGQSASTKGHTDSVSQHSSSSSLSVKGSGAHVEEEAVPVAESESPYLGADEVISEVIVLLARLDNERLETEKKLHLEHEKVARLSRKIDDLCMRRLRDLPILVQKEHEACIIDLNELQWHVAYRRRMEKRIRDRMESAELLNTRYKDDIAFVKRHIPLVQEKLQLEVEAMDKIKRAQGETDQELQVTKQRQAKTEQKSEEAASKAETERGYIKKELDTVRDNLSQISEELSEAKMQYNSYVYQVNDIKQQLKDNSEELKVLKVKNENSKVAEEMQATKVRQIQTKITEAEFENRELDNDNTQLQQELKSLKQRNAHRKFHLQTKVKELESQLRVLRLKNQEAKMEIDDSDDKIIQLTRLKDSDDKKLKSMVRDLAKSEALLLTTLEEFDSVTVLHDMARNKLQTKQGEAFRKEEGLKNAVESLRKQMKEEMHTRTILQARIGSDTVEILKTRQDSAGKKEKAQTIAYEVKNAVNNVLEKVEKLRASKQVKDQRKTELKATIDDMKTQHEESTKTFMEKISVLKPHHTHLKEDVFKIQKRLDHIKWQSDVMKKQTDDMDASSAIMNKVQNSTEKIVKTLASELEEHTLRLNAFKKNQDHLLETYQSLVDRNRQNRRNHVRLLEDRQVVLTRHENEKKVALVRNKDLASRYRQLQLEFFKKKELLLHGYDDQVKSESALTDVKQLHALQKRLHCALAEYYRLSGQFNEAELRKLKGESAVNGQQIGVLQDQLNVALSNIAVFLKEQMSANNNHSQTTGENPQTTGRGPQATGTTKTSSVGPDVVPTPSSHQVMVR